MTPPHARREAWLAAILLGLALPAGGLLPAQDTIPPVPRDGAVTPAGAELDPNAAPRTGTELLPNLTFGGRVELEYEDEESFDLEDPGEEDLSTMDPTLSLAFSYDPAAAFQAFLNVSLGRTIELEGEEGNTTRLQIKQAFLSVGNPAAGPALRIGRQRFKDDQEWLYDQELDALRLMLAAGDVLLDASVSRQGLVDGDLLDQPRQTARIDNYLLHGTYRLGEEVELSAYGLMRHDRSAERRRPIFFGLQSSGEIGDAFDYAIELAQVRGHDGPLEIRGWGLDLKSTYTFDVRLQPSLSAGFGFGSGDEDPEDGVDRSFRQTGLQDNAGRFNGVARFDYYGVMFDPELSNLSVFTAGVGIRPTRRSSVDLIYHTYRQDEASKTIRDGEVDDDPTGRSRSLGSEIDLVAGYRDLGWLDARLGLGYFLPGEAFSDRAANPLFSHLEIRFNF